MLPCFLDELDKLERALENVRIISDDMWSFDKKQNEWTVKNQELLAAAGQLDRQYTYRNGKSVRPETVRDRIPLSRLATYGNYEYDKSRESFYVSDDEAEEYFVHKQTDPKFSCEVWMLPKVEKEFSRLACVISSGWSSIGKGLSADMTLTSYDSVVPDSREDTQKWLANAPWPGDLLLCYPGIADALEDTQHTSVYSHFHKGTVSNNFEAEQLKFACDESMPADEVLSENRHDQLQHNQQQQCPAQSVAIRFKKEFKRSEKLKETQKAPRKGKFRGPRQKTRDSPTKPLTVYQEFTEILSDEKIRPPEMVCFPSVIGDEYYQSDLFPYTNPPDPTPLRPCMSFVYQPAWVTSQPQMALVQGLTNHHQLTSEFTSHTSPSIHDSLHQSRMNVFQQTQIQLPDEQVHSVSRAIPVYQRPPEFYQADSGTGQRKKRINGADFSNLVFLTTNNVAGSEVKPCYQPEHRLPIVSEFSTQKPASSHTFTSPISDKKRKVSLRYTVEIHTVPIESTYVPTDSYLTLRKDLRRVNKWLEIVYPQRSTKISELKTVIKQFDYLEHLLKPKSNTDSSGTTSNSVSPQDSQPPPSPPLPKSLSLPPSPEAEQRRLYRDVLTNNSGRAIIQTSDIDSRFEELEKEALEQYQPIEEEDLADGILSHLSSSPSEQFIAQRFEDLEREAVEQYEWEPYDYMTFDNPSQQINCSQQSNTTESSQSQELINDCGVQMIFLNKRLPRLGDRSVDKAEPKLDIPAVRRPPNQSPLNVIADCQYQMSPRHLPHASQRRDTWIPPATSTPFLDAPSLCLTTPTSPILSAYATKTAVDAPSTPVSHMFPELPSTTATIKSPVWMRPRKKKNCKKKKNHPRPQNPIDFIDKASTYCPLINIVSLSKNLVLAAEHLLSDVKSSVRAMVVKDQFGFRFVKDMLDYALEGTEQRKIMVDSLDLFGYSGKVCLNTGVMGKLARMRKFAKDTLMKIKFLLDSSMDLRNLDQSEELLVQVIESTVEVQVSYEMLCLDIYLRMKLKRPPITVEEGYKGINGYIVLVEDERVMIKYHRVGMASEAKPKLLYNLQKILESFNVNSKLDLVETIFLPFRKIPKEVVKTLIIDDCGTLRTSERVFANTVCQQNLKECVVDRQSDRVLPSQFWQSLPQIIPLVDPYGELYSSFSMDVANWMALHHIHSDILAHAAGVCLQHLLLEWDLFYLLATSIKPSGESQSDPGVHGFNQLCDALSVVDCNLDEQKIGAELYKASVFTSKWPQFHCIDFVKQMQSNYRKIKSENNLIATEVASQREEMIHGRRRHTLNCVRPSVCEYRSLSKWLAMKETEVCSQSVCRSDDRRGLSVCSSFEMTVNEQLKSFGATNIETTNITPKGLISTSSRVPAKNTSNSKNKNWLNSKSNDKLIQHRETACSLQ